MNEGNFVYQSDGKSITWNNWHSGQPHKCSGDEDCVDVKADPEGKWNSQCCSQSKHYVCEKSLPTSFSSKNLVWEVKKEKKYLVHVAKKSHMEAQKFCQSQGGKLFEPKSKMENSEIAALAKEKGATNGIWIGINDRTSEGIFKFDSDGTRISYKNWDHKQPDNGQPNYLHCQLKPDSGGNCNENFPRWYFDLQSGKCKKFIYKGCKGNENNFKTEKECGHSCLFLSTIGLSGEDCVEMLENGKWNDINAYEERSFVCEKKCHDGKLLNFLMILQNINI